MTFIKGKTIDNHLFELKVALDEDVIDVSMSHLISLEGLQSLTECVSLIVRLNIDGFFLNKLFFLVGCKSF